MNEYQTLLLSDEWKSKRLEILKRDKRVCQNCNNDTLYKKAEFGFISREVRRDKEFLIISVNRLATGFASHFFIPSHLIPVQSSSRNYRVLISNLEFNPCTSKEQSDIGPPQVFAIRKYKEVDINLKILLDNINEGGSEDIKSHKNIQDYIAKNFTSLFSDWTVFAGLHVHHQYYKHNLQPWEYPDSALTTLCYSCHKMLHQNQTIPVLDDNNNVIGEMTCCKRCFGTGWFKEFKHIQNGICFRCSGARYEELIKN
jgi:hypothetical protein